MNCYFAAETGSSHCIVAALAGLFAAKAEPKSDAELLLDAASQIITIANRLDRHPTSEDLEWYPEDLSSRMTWEEAKEAVEKIGKGWRLPTDIEWSAEIDRSKPSPPLRDAAKFPGIKSEGYWTSTPCAFDPQGCAWVVFLDDGGLCSGYQDDEFWVRPVRSRRACRSLGAHGG